MSYKKILLTCLCIILNGITLGKNNIEFESDSIQKQELDEKIEYFVMTQRLWSKQMLSYIIKLKSSIIK